MKNRHPQIAAAAGLILPLVLFLYSCETGKKKAVARYRQIQEEIKQMQGKRQQEMIKYSQPGFTDEQKQQNQIKQLEEKKEDKLSPLPVQRASQKTEKLRGVSG